jgi:hypothetical protein
MRPCDLCLEASADPTMHSPPHLVNPQTGEPGLFDIFSEACCPACRAVWRRPRNEVQLVG